jgi:hypothetical protein
MNPFSCGKEMTHEGFINALCHEFEIAFLSTGLKPVNWSFGDGSNDGCMVTALYVSEYGNPKLPRPSTGFWASLKYVLASDQFWASLKYVLVFDQRNASCVEQVRKLLADKHTQFDQEWWDVFVSYCIESYDRRVTFPRQWMKRKRYELVRGDESPKLFGAAVGGLVQRHLFAAAKTENHIDLVPPDQRWSTIRTGADSCGPSPQALMHRL